MKKILLGILLSCSLMNINQLHANQESVDYIKQIGELLAEYDIKGKSVINAQIARSKEILKEIKQLKKPKYFEFSNDLIENLDYNTSSLNGLKAKEKEKYKKIVSLAGLNFYNTQFKNATFIGADLSHSVFLDSKIDGCKFVEVNLRGSQFANYLIENSSFVKSALGHLEMLNFKALNVRFDASDLSISENAAIDNSFEDCTFDNVWLTSTLREKVVLTQCKIVNCTYETEERSLCNSYTNESVLDYLSNCTIQQSVRCEEEEQYLNFDAVKNEANAQILRDLQILMSEIDVLYHCIKIVHDRLEEVLPKSLGANAMRKRESSDYQLTLFAMRQGADIKQLFDNFVGYRKNIMEQIANVLDELSGENDLRKLHKYVQKIDEECISLYSIGFGRGIKVAFEGVSAKGVKPKQGFLQMLKFIDFLGTDNFSIVSEYFTCFDKHCEDRKVKKSVLHALVDVYGQSLNEMGSVEGNAVPVESLSCGREYVLDSFVLRSSDEDLVFVG